MTYFNKVGIRGNDPDDAQIDIEATAQGKLEVVSELNTPVSNLTKGIKYTYDSGNKSVTIRDENIDYIYSVYNQTVDQMLYLINSESFAGVLSGNEVVTYNNTVASVADTDDLIVFYVSTLEGTRDKPQFTSDVNLQSAVGIMTAELEQIKNLLISLNN
jgi:hypothetical protein